MNSSFNFQKPRGYKNTSSSEYINVNDNNLYNFFYYYYYAFLSKLKKIPNYFY